MAAVVNWDELEPEAEEVGHLAGEWWGLGEAAGSVTVGVHRIRVPPGKWSTPAHAELAEEEIFYVLDGEGLSWQEGETYEVRAGDFLVHFVEEATHTLRAGPGGLDVLAFGTRAPVGGTYLPRAGLVRMGPGAAAVKVGKHAWEYEADAGPPELPAAPSERPSRIVALAAVPEQRLGVASVRDVGRALGSVFTGLRAVSLPGAAEGAPPHCHGAEEELFVVLEGTGTCTLGDEEHSVRAGSVVSRPAGTGVAHSFTAGESGMTYLAYGTREPNDIVYYPRAGKLRLRGVGVTLDVGPTGGTD